MISISENGLIVMYTTSIILSTGFGFLAGYIRYYLEEKRYYLEENKHNLEKNKDIIIEKLEEKLEKVVKNI